MYVYFNWIAVQKNLLFICTQQSQLCPSKGVSRIIHQMPLHGFNKSSSRTTCRRGNIYLRQKELPSCMYYLCTLIIFVQYWTRKYMTYHDPLSTLPFLLSWNLSEYQFYQFLQPRHWQEKIRFMLPLYSMRQSLK